MRAWLLMTLTVGVLAVEGGAAPTAVAFRPDGQQLAVADAGLGQVVLIETTSWSVVGRHLVGGSPAHLGWTGDGRQLLISDGAGRRVLTVDGDQVRARAVSAYPRGLAVGGDGTVVVAGWGTGSVEVLPPGGASRRREVCDQPEAVAVTPDGRLAVVVPLVPQGAATDPDQAIAVRVVDLASLEGTSVPLPAGSTLGRGVAITPDGRWACVTHVIGKAAMPNTHIDRGWVSTNALSIIDLQARTRLGSVLLDRLERGAAEPWGIALSGDGCWAWVGLSGVAQVARIDLRRLLALMVGGSADPSLPTIWQKIAQDPGRRGDLAWQLDLLRQSGLIQYLDAGGAGPRALALSPDGRRVAVALFFAGCVQMLDAASGQQVGVVRWADAPTWTPARRGERLFHDATNTFQGWLSCATCHPAVRSDGLNWDLLNDGVGNPKNTRSLVLADERAPAMSLGVRKDGPTAVKAGLRYIAFHEPEPGQADDLLAFLRATRPHASPYLEADGQLSPAAQRGRAVFTGRGECAECHAGPWGSDQTMHDVGTISNPLDRGKKVVTPMLTELWATAPYLHDGSAARLEDVLRQAAETGKHGAVRALSVSEREDLVRYLLSR